MPDTLRVVHVSDIHLMTGLKVHHRTTYARKRLAGFAAGLVTGRRRHFRNAETLLAAFRKHLADAAPDHVVFSGDATTLSLPEEFARAARALELDRYRGVAVPGNHDRYVRAVGQQFEREFKPWQLGERLAGFDYPFAKRVGPVWLIALDSARANWRVTDSTGALGRPQLDRLIELAGRLDAAPKFIVTHYPPAKADGHPEGVRRRLVDWHDAVEAAKQAGIVGWLHGHIHTGFAAPPTPSLPLIRLCAGSLTQEHRQTFCEYTFTATDLTGTRRQYDRRTRQFRPQETFRFGYG